ncbi:galactose mutarotase [Clostridium sp. 19966]|uniref:aldose epimerase family protein n=1 Tax=Clostridium sp. 19966 TaxID=2768166 RepID=UPI0028DE161F|nr:aldose epimerase family protein [Clostridium sp. 19966]MDT8719140.1 galactose mutarotase [Clostridium sp. 19966]
MRYSSKVLGNYNGDDVIEYTIENNNGIRVSVLNLGGVITGIFTPDKNGNFKNIVLGYKNIEDYFENEAYYGAVIGRFAGRIYKGKIQIEDKEYILERNNLEINNLHGGSFGFQRKLWKVNDFKNENELALQLEYISKDGEAGFPGEVKITVKYVLNNNNEFYFFIQGETDKTTVLNITNHSYFNLSGNAERNVLKHKLKIVSHKFLELSEDFGATGKEIDVKGTPFDFREEKEIGKDVELDDYQLKAGGGYDHPFKFDNYIGEVELKDEKSGRVMKVSTNNSYVVIYTTNYPVEKVLYNEKMPEKRMAVCIETQNAPIGVNACYKEQSILKRGEEYKRWTKYKFDILK